MKILVLSDSHGSEENIVSAIHQERDADAIIFLGDGERDFEAAAAEFGFFPYGDDTSCAVYQVKGNCDLFSREAVTIVPVLGGLRILVTHGYDQNVKYGLHTLVREAKERGCAAALFGHTHVQFSGEMNGIQLLNPGSIRSGKYALLIVRDGTITKTEKKEL